MNIAKSIFDFDGYTKEVYSYEDLKINNWYPTNLNLGYHETTGYIAMFRASNYLINKIGICNPTIGDSIYSRLFISNFDPEKYEITNIFELDISSFPTFHGLEDPKLFYNNGWNFSCILVDENHQRSRVVVCKLNQENNSIESFNELTPYNFFIDEKNWMFPNENNENFDCIYGFNAIIKNNNLIKIMTNNPTISEYSYNLRGNTNLLKIEDGYIGIMHTRNKNIFLHNFVKFNNSGQAIGISDSLFFDFIGIEYVAGIVEYKDKYIIGYGSNDMVCKVAILKKETVFDIIKDIEYTDERFSYNV